MNTATNPAFTVSRPCAFGCCPFASGACDCNPGVEVDVDELTAAEVAHFLAKGTPAQRAELTAWLAEGDEGPGLARCEADADDARDARRELRADRAAVAW